MTTLLVSLFLLFAQPASGGGFEGLWRSETDAAIIQIDRCGPSVCGRLLSSNETVDDPQATDDNNRDPALRKRPLKGLPLLSGFTRDGEAWVNGQIYNPDDGRTYRSSLRLENGVLIVKGCVVAGL